jgi:hypothetical protein
MTAQTGSDGVTYVDDKTRASILPGAGTALFATALLLYLARLYYRIHPRLNLGWDDLFLTLSVVSTPSDWLFEKLLR